jgi:hypothetical protein
MVQAVSLIALVLFAVGSPSVASVDARAVGPQIIINEIPVLELRTGGGKYPPEVRASSAAAILQTWNGSVQASAEKAVPASAGWMLKLGTRKVFTVTKEEAAAHESEPEALALSWAESINQSLALDELEVKAETIHIPMGKASEFTLTGSRARKAEVKANTKAFDIERQVGRIVIHPKDFGTGAITIRAAGMLHTVYCSVLKTAPPAPELAEAFVLGDPALRPTVEAAAQMAARRGLFAGDGITRGIQEGRLGVLVPGQRREIDTTVFTSGSQYISSESKASIHVNNIGLADIDDGRLLYSNEPENVRTAGPLYAALLATGSSDRLMVHHRNTTGRTLYMVGALEWRGSELIQVQVVSGEASVDQNPTLAGYETADAFFRMRINRAGSILPLSPTTAMPIFIQEIAPGDTFSWIGSVKCLQEPNGQMQLTVKAVHDVPYPSWKPAGQASTPWARSLPARIDGFFNDTATTEIYTKPEFLHEFAYEVGGQFAFIRLGDEPHTSLNGAVPLQGAFGVNQKAVGTIHNPTDKEVQIDVIFEASAGYTGCLFILNEQYYAARILQPRDKRLLMRKTLNPGQTLPISIDTIPLGGSSYPATITIRLKETVDAS